MDNPEKLELDLNTTIKKKTYCAPQLTIIGGMELVEGSSNLSTDGFNTGS